MITFPYKICIPIRIRAEGGLYTFISYFVSFLHKNNVNFTHNLLSRYDFLLVNSWIVPPYRIFLAKLLLPKLKVIQRVDGSAQDYGRGEEADRRQSKVNRLADLSIFQSNYGRFSTRIKYPIISKDGPVIFNPVDTELFNPSGETVALPKGIKVVHVTFSTNPKKGADQLFRVAKNNPDLNFILCGRYQNIPDLPNIYYVGLLGRTELAKVLRSCHFFGFFSQNEACPNVVLEALASGLPVLYSNSGGTCELVGEAGIAITVDSFREAVEEIWPYWRDWSKQARKRAVTNFSIDKIIPQYLKAFLSIKRRS